jgi:2-polyprenyl-3-methyl-5-hydroxy-6-metoxy-1,4-benzoquinol methylase
MENNKQWFEEWFNSPYYHILYQHRDEKEAERFIRKITEYLKLPSSAFLLDAACGKGRHSRTMAQLGYNVEGIDLSANSIVHAKQFENEHLHFTVHDVREVFKSSAFNAVFNLFSSFGYCEDEQEDYKTMNAFAENLKPNGILVLDYINSEWAVKNMKLREIIPREEIQFHIRKKLENGFIKKTIEFIAQGESHSYTEQLKMINLFKFEQMMKKTGLKLLRTFGDYELNEFNSSLSPRLILVAQKQ